MAKIIPSERLVVVVTGASTGIGLACALRLDERGFTVYAGVRKQVDAERVASLGSERLRPLLIDVVDEASVERARAEVAGAVAERGIAGLVNNAGIAVGGPTEFLAVDEFRRQFEVNFFGQIAVTKAFLPLLRAGAGRIANMSSMGGRTATPFLSPYSSSKWALEAWTEALRGELRPWGIWVCAIEPGAIRTPIWDKAVTDVTAVRDELPEEAIEQYGGALDAVDGLIAHQAKVAVPAERVAKAVDHALTARRPKTRYPVGPDARVGLKLRWLLPDRAWDWIVRKFSGMP